VHRGYRACTEAYDPRNRRHAYRTYVASLRGLQGLMAHTSGAKMAWRSGAGRAPFTHILRRFHRYARVHRAGDEPLPNYGHTASLTPTLSATIGANESLANSLLCCDPVRGVRYRHRHRRARRRAAHRGIKRIIVHRSGSACAGLCARKSWRGWGFAQVDVCSRPLSEGLLVFAIRRGFRRGQASPLEHAIFDPESRMLRGFISGLAAQSEPGARAG